MGEVGFVLAGTGKVMWMKIGMLSSSTTRVLSSTTRVLLNARLMLLSAMLGVYGGAVLAQQSSSSAVAPPAARVYLDVVVEAKAGTPATGLAQQDFTVLVNKVPQPMASFAERRGHDAPVEVILVLDAANAGYQTVAFARDQLKRFLQADGGELAFPTTLAVLTDKGVEIQPGTSRDGKVLSEALDKYGVALRSLQRSAGFFGAEERLDLSLKGLSQLTAFEANKPGRKLMVWISPGWPLLSGPRVDLSLKQEQQLYGEVTTLSTQLRNARVTMYSVDPLGSSESLQRTQYYKQFVKGVSKPSQVLPGDLGLQVLATQTGGLALTSSNDLAALLQRTVDDAKSFYEISFDPPPAEPSGEFHSIEVKIAKPGLVARTRTGYYSRP